MKVSFLTLELHLKRLLQSMLTVGGVTALVWCFCYSIRSFFRDEPLHLTLLMVLLLKTLPAIIPFMSAVSTQLCVIRMHKKKEWPLLELMGLRPCHRHVYFLPATLLLCFASTLLEFPYASFLNEKGQALFLKQQLAEVRPDRPLMQGNWEVFKLYSGNLLLQGDKQWVLTASARLDSHRGDALLLQRGVHWSEVEEGIRRRVSFDTFRFPLAGQSESYSPEGEQGRLRANWTQLIRVFTLPMALYLLGYQLGLLHHRSGFRRSSVLTFICLFLVYYPSTIIGKDLAGESFRECSWMFLPHVLCLIMAKGLAHVHGQVRSR